MAWLEITVSTVDADLNKTAASLTAAGFSDLVLEDQTEFEDFLEQNKAYWDYIDEELQQQLQGLSRIKLYLEDSDEASMSCLKALVAELALTMEVAALPETDWEESWKDNYPPVELGESIVILPYWLVDSYDGGRKPVVLDPGLTFGTGNHPTTQMVVEAMEQMLKPGAACLDLGSGSGILSLAALRLGAKSAVGVDIDPKAEDIARENAAYNGFAAPEFTALTGNVTTGKPLMDRLSRERYDMVLVNIVADVIIGLAPVLPNFMNENTDLICSGILCDRLEEVVAAIRKAGLTVTSIRCGEEWRCITVKKEN